MNSITIANWLNVSEVNCVPLLDIRICDIPYLAKGDVEISIVCSLDVVDF